MPRFEAHQSSPIYDSYGQEVTPLIPYDVNAEDLIAYQQQNQLQAKVANEEGQFVASGDDFYTYYPRQLTGEGNRQQQFLEQGAAATAPGYEQFFTGPGSSGLLDIATPQLAYVVTTDIGDQIAKGVGTQDLPANLVGLCHWFGHVELDRWLR